MSNDLNPTEWAWQMLHAGGWPVTYQNGNALMSWAAQEGGHWHNTRKCNPLNTTFGCGSTSDPGVKVASCGGVQGDIASYADWSSGVRATILTLNGEGHGYEQIKEALGQGTNGPGVIAAVDASQWGTHGASYHEYYKSDEDFVKAVLNKDLSQGPGLVDSVKEVAKAVAKPLEWTAQLAKLLGKLLDPHFWIRVGEGAGGLVLILLGFHLLFPNALSGVIP